MQSNGNGNGKPEALALLASQRPRNVGWIQAAGMLFGDWGTSRLYVLGLAFLFAGRTSFWLILLMSVLIVAVGWAYAQICRIYPDGGGVYTAAKGRSRTLAVVGVLLLFADYTVTASLSALEGFHYFGLPLKHHMETADSKQDAAAPAPAARVKDAGDDIVIEHVATFDQPLAALPPGLSLPPPHKGAKEGGAKEGGAKEGNEKEGEGKKVALWFEPAESTLKLVGAMTPAQRDGYLARSPDAAYQGAVNALYEKSQPEGLFAWDSPGLWAIVAIAVIGLFNLMGPKHTGGFAIFAALGMVLITLLITLAALPQIEWAKLPGQISAHPFRHGFKDLWFAFVSIVLALSGVEAIANLTGVMTKPVARTAKRSIFIVTAEVALFNVLLALAMMAIPTLDRAAHTNDMLAHLAWQYTHTFLHQWGEWLVRGVGGLLLLSAANTAVNGLMSIVYIVSRDGELPAVFQRVNRFGAPWIAAILATGVPILVLLVIHDLEGLAALYAIGVIGAVAINVTLCSLHPRLRRMRRKVPMLLLGVVLLAIWVTLAYVKQEALVFVTLVMAVGLSGRWLTRFLQDRKGPRLSLLRQAIVEQLTPQALARPKLLVGTYGSDGLAPAALVKARENNASLVVCFVREVALSYKYGGEKRLNIDTDLAAQKTFARFLELGHIAGVPVIPVYDTGANAAELMAEHAAINGCERVLIGTSRHGALYHMIKGHYQRRLEAILPPEIPVEVVVAEPHPEVFGEGGATPAVAGH